MAFNNIKIVGDGTALTAITNTTNTESVINSLVAYNSTTGALSFSLLIDSVVVVTESIEANGSFRLPDKLNVPVDTVLTVNADTGVDVSVSYFTQAIDINAADTTVQQMVIDVEADRAEVQANKEFVEDTLTPTNIASINTAATNITAIQNAADNAAIAQGAANFKGVWSDASDYYPYAVGVTVISGNTRYLSLIDSNSDTLDVTASWEPLTMAAGGSSFTVVAKGDIAEGKAVALNSDGTVSEVGVSGTDYASDFHEYFEGNLGTNLYIGSVALGDGRFVFMYSQASDYTNLYVQAGEYDDGDGSITFGDAVLVTDSNTISGRYMQMLYDGTTVVMGFIDTVDDDRVFVATCTINSGLVLTAKAPIEVYAPADGAITMLTGVLCGTSQVLFSCQRLDVSYSFLIDYSDTDNIAYSAAQDTGYDGPKTFLRKDGNPFVASTEDFRPNLVSLEITGSTTFSISSTAYYLYISPVDVTHTYLSNTLIFDRELDRLHCTISYSGSGRLVSRGYYIDLQDDFSTIGNLVATKPVNDTLGVSNYLTNHMTYTNPDSKTALLIAGDRLYTYYYFRNGKLLCKPYFDICDETYRCRSIIKDPNSDKLIAIGNDDATDDGQCIVVSKAVSNWGAYIGIADSNATDGGECTVIPVGGVSTKLSGLTPNSKVFLNEDGSFSNIKGDNYYLGDAISATKMLLKED